MKGTALTVDIAVTDTIEFRPLVFHEDAGQVLVGVRGGKFLSVSRTGALAVKLLSEGVPVGAARRHLEERLGTANFTIIPLLEALLAAGAVRSIGPLVLPVRGARPAGMTFRSEGCCIAWLFSPSAIAFYLMLVLGGVIAVAASGWPLLSVTDLPAETKYSTLALLGLLIVALNSVKHELAHAAAAAYVGVDSRISFGYRFLFPVLQTDLTGLWAVPRNKRFIAYLAGIASDLLLLAVVVILAAVVRGCAVSTGIGLLKLLTLSFFVVSSQIAWQFNVFLRTDLYYLLAALLNCRNLHADGKTWLRSVCRLRAGNDRLRAPLKVKLYGAGIAITYLAYSVLAVGSLAGTVCMLRASHPFVAQGRVIALNIGDKVALAGILLLHFVMLGWAKYQEKRAEGFICQIRASGTI